MRAQELLGHVGLLKCFVAAKGNYAVADVDALVNVALGVRSPELRFLGKSKESHEKSAFWARNLISVMS